MWYFDRFNSKSVNLRWLESLKKRAENNRFYNDFTYLISTIINYELNLNDYKFPIN